MKDVNAMLAKCIDELSAIGIHPRPIRSVRINRRAKKRWGQAIISHATGTCTIEISSRLVDDDIPDWPLHNTMIHEILHCVEGTKGHTGKWKVLAEKCNRKLGTNIKRCSDYSDVIKPQQGTYAIQCQKCGAVITRQKMSKVIAHPDHYRCKCGGQLKRIR